MWIDVNPEPDDLAFEIDLSNVAFSCDEHDLEHLAQFFDDIGCDGTAETLRAALQTVAYENRQMLRVIDLPRLRQPRNLIAEADDVLQRLLREEAAIRRSTATDGTMNIIWDDPGVISEGPVMATNVSMPPRNLYRPPRNLYRAERSEGSDPDLAWAHEQWEVLSRRAADLDRGLEAT